MNPSRIIVVNTCEEWEMAFALFTKDFIDTQVIGFDCEWTRETPLSLVQICNEQGVCLLLRIAYVFRENGKLPESFVKMLENRKVLKTGVDIHCDSKRLEAGYGVVVRGCVDLRLLLVRVNVPNIRPLGLKYLCKVLLGVVLEKDVVVRCSDWDVCELSEQQKHYAAMDSLVSLEIFKELIRIQMNKSASRIYNAGRKDDLAVDGCSRSIKIYMNVGHDGSSVDDPSYNGNNEDDDGNEYNNDDKEIYNVDDQYQFIKNNCKDKNDSIAKCSKFNDNTETVNIQSKLSCINDSLKECNVFDSNDIIRGGRSNDNIDTSLIKPLCQGIIDVKFKEKNAYKEANKTEKKMYHDKKKTIIKDPATNNIRSGLTHGLQGRKTPLYDNCMLCDQTGAPLTTCDARKARWYMEKGLAEKISDNPLSVKLLFEPSGRPMVGNGYYLQEKENVCVVCGASDSYHRKNIIPREYRKHFPPLFKDHKSHDVILLCTTCHQHSTLQDSLQKQSLALAYNAPIRSDKYDQSYLVTKAKSAAKALKGKHKIPEERRLQLIEVLKGYYKDENGVEEDDQEKLIDFVIASESKKLNPAFEEHGKIVVAAISSDKQGLIDFERMWRQHFVDTMQPQYLPKLWSVDHCHDVLNELC